MQTIRTVLLLCCCFPALALAVQQYSFRVIDQKPLPGNNWVQGLEIVDDYLYVGTGKYDESHLLRYRFSDGELEAAQKLNRRIYGEGLTVFGDRIYQLTYRNRMLLVYNRADLKPIEWHPIPGEGWGMTHNGKEIIYSDGSDRLHFIAPATHEITRSIKVREQGKAVLKLNELEWIDGKIWANIWMTDYIVVIDPDSGEVSARIDLQGLLPAEDYTSSSSLLNGIARNPADGSIWVTGKYWRWLYRIELIPSAQPKETPHDGISR